MPSHPKLAGSALLILAFVHAWWGFTRLLASDLLLAGSQLVSVGGLVLAAVAAGHRSRSGVALGFGIAAGATALRSLSGLGAPSAFAAATGLLALGMFVAAWGSRRLMEREDPPAAVALRGGALVMAFAYLGFLALSIAQGGFAASSSDFVVRALAAAAFAVWIDAPPMIERKAFAGEASSAAR